MLFRKSEEKQAREAALQAELDRLKALSPDALAVEVLPALAAKAETSATGRVDMRDICKGLVGVMSGQVNLAIGRQVREAVQRLEHANLVVEITSQDGATFWRLTTEGQQAVAAGDVAARLTSGG